MVLKGYEQNIRVIELQKSSPFCSLLFSQEIVKETLDAMKISPVGMHAFFKKKHFFSLSSNMPFKNASQSLTTPKTSKSPAQKLVVFHPSWSKSAQPRASKKTESGNKTPSKLKSPFMGEKLVPTKSNEEVTSSDLKVGGRLWMYADDWCHNSWAYKVVFCRLS